MLIGDYEFGRGAENVNLLKMMSNIAAASHAPCISNVSPKMMGMECFTKLGNPCDMAKVFDTVEYASLKSFRESEDSRYVDLAMPKVLGRLPYGKEFRSGCRSTPSRRMTATWR